MYYMGLRGKGRGYSNEYNYSWAFRYPHIPRCCSRTQMAFFFLILPTPKSHHIQVVVFESVLNWEFSSNSDHHPQLISSTTLPIYLFTSVKVRVYKYSLKIFFKNRRITWEGPSFDDGVHLWNREDSSTGVSYPGYSSGGTSNSISNDNGGSSDADYFGMIFGSGSGTSSGAPPPPYLFLSLLIISILYLSTLHGYGGGLFLFL